MKPHPYRLFLILLLVIGLVASSCNLPGKASEIPEPAPTEAEQVTERPTLESGGSSEPTEAMEESGPPTPTLDPSSIDPLGGRSPIVQLYPTDSLLTLTYVWMFNATSGWAIGDVDGSGDHIFLTDIGPIGWDDVTPPAPRVSPEEGHPVAAVGAFLDDSTARVLYYPDVSIFESGGAQNAYVWRTEDGGATWRPSFPMRVDMIGSSQIPPYFVFSDANHGWIMMHWGSQGMHHSPIFLFRTTDGGTTWEELLEPYSDIYLGSCSKTGMDFYGANYGLVTIADCPVDGIEVDWTNDGGQTWEALRPPPPASRPDLFTQGYCNAYSPTFLSDGTAKFGAICKVFGDVDEILYLLYTSTDNGASWTVEEYPGGDLFYLNSNTVWGLSEVIYRTLDGGSHWTNLDTVTWQGQFVFIDQDNGWAIARNEDEIATVATDDGGANWWIVESYVTE